MLARISRCNPTDAFRPWYIVTECDKRAAKLRQKSSTVTAD